MLSGLKLFWIQLPRRTADPLRRAWQAFAYRTCRDSCSTQISPFSFQTNDILTVSLSNRSSPSCFLFINRLRFLNTCQKEKQIVQKKNKKKRFKFWLISASSDSKMIFSHSVWVLQKQLLTCIFCILYKYLLQSNQVTRTPQDYINEWVREYWTR